MSPLTKKMKKGSQTEVICDPFVGTVARRAGSLEIPVQLLGPCPDVLQPRTGLCLFSFEWTIHHKLTGTGFSASTGNSEAGKAICRQITAAARAQMERIKQAKDTKQTIHQGATNDNR